MYLMLVGIDLVPDSLERDTVKYLDQGRDPFEMEYYHS